MAAPTPGLPHPERVGPYRIEGVLGQGGMGAVYRAVQEEPIRREVALKVIKLGMDTREVIARFEVERQTLALMDHPAIAKVYDAGATEEGRPFFVMELVDGVPLHDYCDTHRLTIRERVELFVDVCLGIQHAHQRGVIHRDLKPSNVLITEVDGRPVPKVIDFGIARATDPGPDDNQVTRIGELVGTPAYMSPEQAEGGGADLDIRTDVYSLGVMLYEVLSGTLPFTEEQLSKGGLQLLAALFATDLPRPSARLARIPETQQTIAELRRTRVETLRRELSGELDWIVMRAIEKARDRRYSAVGELVRDLRAFLADEPVEAKPPTAWYLVRKFARRNRVGVAFAATLLLGIVAFAGAMTVQAGAIARERDRAELEASKSSAVNDFMTATLLAPDPIEGLGRDVTMVEALEHAISQLDTAFAGQPEMEAAASSAIGWALFQMGRYDDAEPLLSRALAIRRDPARDPSPDLAESVQQWAQLQHVRGRFDSAAVLYRRAIQMRREQEGQEAPAVARPLKHLGILLTSLGRNEEGETALREALGLVERTPDSLEIADLRNQIAVALWNQGELDDVGPLWTSALEIRRAVLGDEHPLVAESLNNLAVLYDNTDRPDAAEPLYREALAIQRKLLGDDHEEVAAAAANLAVLLDVKGEYEEAEELYREALRIDRGQFGDDHPIVGHDLVNLGAFVCAVGRPLEGLPAIDEALGIYQTVLEAGHWRIGNALNWRGTCHRALENLDSAEQDFLQALATMVDALGEDHYRADAIRGRLADLYEVMGMSADAERYRR